MWALYLRYSGVGECGGGAADPGASGGEYEVFGTTAGPGRNRAAGHASCDLASKSRKVRV